MKDFILSLTRFFTAIALALSAYGIWTGNTSYVRIDASDKGDNIVNIVDNVNVWDMGTRFYSAQRNEENDIFEFVRYVQLMQCTGGNESRDLFIDPHDTSTYTDYKFEGLIKNCRGILSLGAKPHLKLGNVPLKFTAGSVIGAFGVNLYAPDDYELYYNYIKAIAGALVDEFGLDEVRTWRFGCMTEFENKDWFMARSGDPEESAEDYCRLYDYTVQALLDVIGEDVFVGAHAMAVTEGLWDEAKFIEHVARGTNYANGGTGTRICFLSGSFYDYYPGKYTEGFTLPETLRFLMDTAEKYGLDNLIYGIDEGRILGGNSSGAVDSQLSSRTCGYTWQAAYDARLFKQAIDCGADYFSSWCFLSGGLLNGYPTVSYHVAKNLSAFGGSQRVKSKVTSLKADIDAEIDCLAGWDEESGTLRAMVYNFKNDVNYDKKTRVKLKIALPELDGRDVKVTRYLINDDCNYFDEWQKDRFTYGITDSCFSWSPDDPCIDDTTILSDPTARSIYLHELRDKYIECSRLVPATENARVKNGRLALTDDLDASGVIFYEITASD